MKPVKYKKLLALSLIALITASSANANGEGQDSHGGIGVVCRNADDSIKSAELLDLFEYESTPGSAPLMAETATIAEALKIVDLKLRNDKDGVSSIMADIIKDTMKNFVNKDWSPLKSEIDLVLDLSDSLPSKNRRGCNFEQIANYHTNGLLEVNMDIYNKLTPMNQAALKIHEAIYKNIRQVKVLPSTKMIRDMVGELFSSKTDQSNLFDLCKSLMYNSPTSPIRKTTYSQAEATEYLDVKLDGKKLFCTDKTGKQETEFSVTYSNALGFVVGTPSKDNGLFWGGMDLDIGYTKNTIWITESDDGSHSIEIPTQELDPTNNTKKPNFTNAKLHFEWDDSHSVEAIYCWLK